ncbi:hypothetical protein HanRHA438_Chr09g0382811 [Helianthus annuus]|uniref:Uncharacterized protein n=1 Tax=Helianthus annuus TaxID=4232 RepID=A0A251TSA2_HELAN|nr:uncharacterized protein LOC110877492 [Helianthus annuus]KAF5789438.1 hypothetical protein HanXRQr2_Chr09g0371231 [Helianthus annuus]KAJ0524819.1 hypothetical protein HanHA300_Chr09g0304931 [Helianthus annuus]KAJ0532748.1 hypothetical protein HanIR_Chr09g0400441 [Helianthus annuus]KAJ0541160.1 hypothetical protein HanHA89_Chr09g0325301 [Helianthus annuus]KAJ0706243.1 hypothetical protein HanLR1_Chr09g0304811 [Helianthus annuus]
MMSKKMKLDYEDARARFKHQTLFQDYMELQQETEAARSNLMALKQNKLTLQAEVRFLRRRHKFLLENKSSTLQEQVFMNPQPTHIRKSNKEKVHMEKWFTLPKLPPSGKKKTPRSIPSPEFDLTFEDSFYGVKQQSAQRAIANQRVRINGPKASTFLDLSQKDDAFGSQKPSGQTRKPEIDLNQISREEEELEEQREPFDHVMHGLMRKGVDEQHTDERLSMFRNVGSGKRKVSWQDPVAVRV